jgi:hypothetical protein
MEIVNETTWKANGEENHGEERAALLSNPVSIAHSVVPLIIPSAICLTKQLEQHL